jgi:transposase
MGAFVSRGYLSTLKRVDQPDHVVLHPALDVWDVCQRALPEGEMAQSPQVFDLPPTRFEVTEHIALRAQYTCGKVHVGTFPEHVRAHQCKSAPASTR